MRPLAGHDAGQHFWWLPCIAAGAVMVAFALLFKNETGGGKSISEEEMAEEAPLGSGEGPEPQVG